MSLYERLLHEGMKTPADLPPGFAVQVSQSSGRLWISYVKRVPGGSVRQAYDNEAVWGHLWLRRPDGADGPCGGAYIVGAAEAERGWGPLLYDVAMEYASARGSSLAPDRSSVSGDARRVWTTYAKRSGVTGKQLDNPKNELTPSPADNCDQTSAKRGNRKGKKDWSSSVLSRAYSKGQATTKWLKRLGKLAESSLYDRIVESYPNRVRGQAQTQDTVPSGSEPDNSDVEDEVEQPMTNPLPGNIDPRALTRGGGSRLHQRRRPPKAPR